MTVHHITNSSHYHFHNGCAERYVRFVKSMFDKPKEADDNPPLAKMLCHNTLLGNDIQSLIELPYGRKTRSDMPISHPSLMKEGK